jgi:multiple sugar transport system substrate-binding protein
MKMIVNRIDRLKQLLRRSILVLLILMLTGCNAIAPPPDGKIHLTLWQGINPPPNREVFARLVDKFNRDHSDIKVESFYVGQSDRQLPKILASIVGNAAPDLLWFAPMLTGQLVELEAIEPLDSFWRNSPITKDIDPTLIESMQLENHLWSIPFATNNVQIFYRPSLFKAAGIDRLPTTWEQLKQTAKKLTRDLDRDGKIDRYGMLLPLGKGEWTVFTWLPFMWSGGGELTPPINLVNDGAMAALQLWQDLIRDRTAILSAPERGYELDNFLSGKVAMQLTGPWTLGQLASTQVDYDVMPIPRSVRPATSIGGENLFMFKNSPPRQQAAWQFMEYVMSEEFQTEWAMGTGYLPINLKSRDRRDYRDYVAKTPATQVFIDLAPSGRSRPIALGYNQLSEQIGRAIESVLLDRSTPRSALETAQSRLNLDLTEKNRSMVPSGNVRK